MLPRVARPKVMSRRTTATAALALTALVALVATAVIARRAVVNLRHQTAAHRPAAPLPPPPPGEEPISFRTADALTLRGWLHRGDNHSLVVLVHGLEQSRLDRLVEARALAARGFSTLVFDLRAHGESEGDQTTLGDRERLDVAAALDAALEELHPDKVGLLGFSIGGTAVQDVAARDERVNAVVLVAPTSSVRGGLEDDFGRWGPLSFWPALLAARRQGLDLEAGHWASTHPSLARRGLLLIAGDREPKMDKVRAMLGEAKRAGAETLLVPGATHGNYARAAPELYPAQLVDFFVRRLATAR